MSCNDTVRVLEALNVLCNVSEEALQSHRAEALLAFRKLRTFVGDDGYTLTSQECDDRAPPFRNNHGTFSPSSEDSYSSLTVLNNNESSSQALNGQGSSASSFHQNSSPPSPDGHELPLTPTKSILDLVEALHKESTQIKKYLSRPESEATGDGLKRMTEDPRVVDLQLDKCRSSPNACLSSQTCQRR